MAELKMLETFPFTCNESGSLINVLFLKVVMKNLNILVFEVY